MAYRGYKVKVWIPYGRKRTVSILMNHLQRFRPIVDEVMLWSNTDEKQVEDREYMHQLAETFPDWVKIYELPEGTKPLKPKQLNTSKFYLNAVDPKTIYIRFDDDIVFIDDHFFENILDFRIDNPKYFLVFANIWNNAITSYIHQQAGRIGTAKGVVEEPYCMDMVAWAHGGFAKYIHEILIKHIRLYKSTKDLWFDKYELPETRFSISCFAFFGKDMKKLESGSGKIPMDDEEIFLTEVYPRMKNKLNVICGTALVSHYSFFQQRDYLDDYTTVLKEYATIAKLKLSESYYTLLGNK